MKQVLVIVSLIMLCCCVVDRSSHGKYVGTVNSCSVTGSPFQQTSANSQIDCNVECLAHHDGKFKTVSYHALVGRQIN